MRQINAIVAVAAMSLAACTAREPDSRSMDTNAGANSAGPAPGGSQVRDSIEVYVAHGACPFECCIYGKWTLLTPATLHAAASSSSETLATLDSGTAVRADSGQVQVRPGLLVMVTKSPRADLGDTVTFAPGDSVELLDYVGEGVRRVRWHGRELQMQEFWRFGDTAAARVVREPVQHWWTHMTAGTRRQGWVLMDSVRVRGADACG